MVIMDVQRLLNPFFQPSKKTDNDKTKWPSCYPPNGNPRAETVDGCLGRRDHLPLRAFTVQEYKKYGATDTRIKELVYEDTRIKAKGSHPSRTVIHRVTKEDVDLYYSFGSCNNCYRTGNRNFGDPDLTPYLTRVDVQHPLLPQVGLCGCIICNECICKLLSHPQNKDK